MESPIIIQAEHLESLPAVKSLKKKGLVYN